MPETDSDTDPMALAGVEDTRTERERMFDLSKDLYSDIARLTQTAESGDWGNVAAPFKACEQKALALSLYLKEQAK